MGFALHLVCLLIMNDGLLRWHVKLVVLRFHEPIQQSFLHWNLHVVVRVTRYNEKPRIASWHVSGD